MFFSGFSLCFLSKRFVSGKKMPTQEKMDLTKQSAQCITYQPNTKSTHLLFFRYFDSIKHYRDI